jgi:plastocyanin
VVAAAAALAAGCQEPPDPSLQPDAVLQAELGLTPGDRVHRVRLTGGEVERTDPDVITIHPGAFVEFVTTDWFVHEVVFEVDSLAAGQRAFLERTEQVVSPPLIERDSRYVLTFEGAPPGRYPYRLEGNGRAGRGAIFVASPAPP